MWLILSKDVAKLGYDERPAVIWNEAKQCYCCPACGQPIQKEYCEGTGRRKISRLYRFGMHDFRKKTAMNQVCTNAVKVFDKSAGTWTTRDCGTKLWTAYAKTCRNNWTKFGNGIGWYENRHIDSLLDELNSLANPKREDLEKIAEFSAYVRGESTAKAAPRKYPIAKYIHRYLKGYIDYVIFDEIHLLKAGDSLQGEAFGDLASIAKKIIGLTGTLVNGYASGIYYILFRAFPKLMKKYGYRYGSDGENNFVKDFGVIKQQYSIEWRNGTTGQKIGQSKTKSLPGISPLVFTKFLLENTAFLNIDDISNEMPSYSEIPVPVEMDDELKQAYQRLSTDVHNNMDFFRHAKLVSQMFNVLSTFPDQPYDQPPVIDIEHNREIISPPSIAKLDIRNKETKLLELVQDKKDSGDKVLIYYTFVNRTDIAKRIPKLLSDNGFRVATLNANVSSRDREQWIRDRVNDIDVLLCNPSLVETGLDLIDFRAIIYYQCGYNTYTMRQASRRSWRLSQDKDVEVYFLYYKDTIREPMISLMATKIQAAMAIEGKFDAEGLNALSNNEDILTQLAANFADNVKQTVDVNIFEKTAVKSHKIQKAEMTRLIDVPRDFVRPSVYDEIGKSQVSIDIIPILNKPQRLFAVI